MATGQNDFSKGQIWRSIVRQAVPLTLAQLVQLLYNIVDRVYIGHLPDIGELALTGVGLCFPVITIIAAFTNMFATGGTPLFSIARGAGDEKRASDIMGNVFSLIVLCSAALTALFLIFRRPVLFLFGAGEESYVYANQYLRIYLWGTIFSMLGTGLNGFINAQGFPKFGMLTTVLGAVLNLVLDPLFIFVFDMGVSGAAIATVISQAISALWVLRFLTGPRTIIPLQRSAIRLQGKIVGKVVTLGLSGFVVMGTNALVQISCNATLQNFGGDLYVGIMTVLNSVREVLALPINGIISGAQPVLGFNYGAKQYDRVKQGIRFSAFLGIAYTFAAWGLVLLLPRFLMSIFTTDSATIETGIHALRIYFFGFCFMAFQYTGQSTFQALGYARRSICFSLLRKVVIVVPLTLLLPRIGMGVNGVFIAEPVSNLLGGMASFLTMYFTVYRRLDRTKNESTGSE